ncbi:hypothetical protein EV193_101428 [Herbihabitans rhizosphaerae]|uniref:Uncharacterized protein n=1 Tax=Herbihabitans rhizosphaerae TaxID=1872711 RepID=A0A4Q7L842_9PSEU|nr:hypothetical protein [Herbihabitans rhizosphaerae]RZS44552.1 hypothetical protein EV193_101428 [Herbihabitans rhizosphaerae]
MSAQSLEEAEAAWAESATPSERGGLNRPWRAIVAGVELLLAVAAVFAAFWAWPRGIEAITMELDGGVRLDSTLTHGYWQAAAIGFGLIAAILVLDALRQLVLAIRTRGRHRG